MQVLRMTWMFNIMDYNFMIVSCLLIMTRLLHVYYCVVLTIGYCIIFGLKFPFKKGWMWVVMNKKGLDVRCEVQKVLDVRCEVQKGLDVRCEVQKGVGCEVWCPKRVRFFNWLLWLIFFTDIFKAMTEFIYISKDHTPLNNNWSLYLW